MKMNVIFSLTSAVVAMTTLVVVSLIHGKVATFEHKRFCLPVNPNGKNPIGRQNELQIKGGRKWKRLFGTSVRAPMVHLSANTVNDLIFLFFAPKSCPSRKCNNVLIVYSEIDRIFNIYIYIYRLLLSLMAVIWFTAFQSNYFVVIVT